MTTTASDNVDRRELNKVTAVAGIGTFIDYYDYFLAVFISSIVFNKIFFPSSLPTAIAAGESIASTVGVGYLSRPIGALIFGHFGDKLGRRGALIGTLALAVVGLVGISVLPTYALIGVWSVFLLITFRLLFGIAMGGEMGGALSWTSEFAAKIKRRGLQIGMVGVSGAAGSLMATVGLVITTHFTTPTYFLYTGWRIMYAVGAVAVILAIIARYKASESPMFVKLKAEGILKPRGSPIIGTLRYNWYKILILAWIPVVGTVVATTFSAYVPLYLTTSSMHFTTSFAYTLTTISSGTAVVLTIIIAFLSDVLGRKRTIVITIAIGTWIFAVPSMLFLLPSLKPELLIPMSFIFSSLVLSAFGAYPSLFAESFETKYRYTASGLTHQMNNVYGGLIFAFLFPYLLTTYGISGSITPLVVTFIVLSVISLGAVLWAKETKGIKMS